MYNSAALALSAKFASNTQLNLKIVKTICFKGCRIQILYWILGMINGLQDIGLYKQLIFGHCDYSCSPRYNCFRRVFLLNSPINASNTWHIGFWGSRNPNLK